MPGWWPGGTIFIDTDYHLAMGRGAAPASWRADGGNELAGDRREKPLYDVVMLGVQRASGGCVGAAAVGSGAGHVIRPVGLMAAARWRQSRPSTVSELAPTASPARKAVTNSAARLYCWSDFDKIPAAARFVVAASSDIDVLVVEENISREYRVAFQQHDIRIYTV